jgi:hypothetical protein
MAFNMLNILALKTILGVVSIPFLQLSLSDFTEMFMIYLAVQSIFILGATMFKKSPLFYTFLFSFVATILYSFVQVMMAKYIFSDLANTLSSSEGMYSSNSYSLTTVFGGGEFIVSSTSLKITHIFLAYILPLSFWVAAWFKIKEKEV